MPHVRRRYFTDLALHALKHYPLVGVLGHRQVGKTTLLRQLTDRYLTFDDVEVLESAHRSPKAFLSNEAAPSLSAPIALDECQLAPPLFPALKEAVRKSARPGQYLLSGSVRFTSRKAIRESLTGRIINFELYPMSISELESCPLPNVCQKALRTEDFIRQNPFAPFPSKKSLLSSRARIQQYLERGGLPGICLIREESFRLKKIQEQLFTILDRDLRQVHPTSLTYPEILSFAQQLARFEGIPLSQSEIRRATGISPAAQKKLLFAFEALFLIRPMLLEGGRKGLTLYFEDQAEHRFLNRSEPSLEDRMSALVYRHVRIEWAYRLGPSPRFFHYLTRGGARVPIAVEEGGETLGFMPISGESPDKAARASAASFLRAYARSKVIFFSFDRIFDPYAHDSRAMVAPVEYLV